MLGRFHRFLTTSRPTKYLIFVLIGSWMWLWIVSDYPPVLWYVGNSLVVVAFLWLRHGRAIQEDLARQASPSRRNPSQRKRDFLGLIGTTTILPLVITLWFDPRTGFLLLFLLGLLALITLYLMPGDLIPEGWLTEKGFLPRAAAKNKKPET